MIAATYQIILKLNGQTLGDIRTIAQDFNWSRYRTNQGVDSIEFTINDKLLERWCADRQIQPGDILKPIALEATITRNGEAVAGGFLATMPAYKPNAASANLELRFDGYINLLAGVILPPAAQTTKRADQFVTGWITEANTRSANAGKGYNFTQGTIKTLGNVQRTYENYKTIKEAILQMTDNVDGAGQFDVIFNPDKSYDITDSLGRDITDWSLYYPPRDGGQSAATISAPEIQGFASSILTLGAGEVSSDPAKTTVITKQSTNAAAVAEFGYYEAMTQYSSVTQQTTLNQHNATDLANAIKVQWEPQITLLGIQTPPSPTAAFGLWLGDRIRLINTADVTGMTSGLFRINALRVEVSSNGAETITPTMERAA